MMNMAASADRPMKPCERDSDHEWRSANSGPEWARLYECAKCGATEERDVS